ncbi:MULTISPECIES: branched-chain amino acid ABC transporter permease [Bradyrhizobium]|uniref:Branched-chain amino acid transport system permease protein n=1 Tax=Bradyrhizobium yuanmingense TaxID=108015 RepID=A0ABV4GA63_9BRAD|nr:MULTISPECIES: branched-chain amino acid ABC transporter permease [Bradyrhizobium]MCA1359201.1 branched-chain amino acid ABC transporter permease [Bradyrhizobium sp. IC4059]MCA1409721.1 branched-chain amino acid ABC transporter permease [Bradyrhizobium sp. NBAIM20]MCA1425022.1 branched-chain amino acid ABC transporter permease [Bradyrhizobium sp. NBAIM16]MCA1434906.1 branched-chain amino acid ABC transporter permease [Bradyrhizobium sp. BRP20]MCA1459352.1 branched-chain amino acid ABC transp
MAWTGLSIGLDALSYGMVLFIISIGLSIMMGLMRVVNLAHGAFAMIGGYLASFALKNAGVGYPLAIVLAVLGTIAIAFPLEFLLYRRIYRKSDELTQILLTIGIAFVIIGVANYILGPTTKSIPLPPLLSGPVDLGFRMIPAHRIFVTICGVCTAGLLWLLIDRTEFGIRLRAAVDNGDMAESLGIKTQILFSATFALAVGLAAFGGVVGAELLPVEPFYALRYMVTFLVVVSVGGAGSIPGAVAASILLGLADTTGKYLAPEYGEFFFYLAVILVVFLFPNGLLGRRH